MNLLLFCGILTVILSNCHAVHPGDPFPTDLSDSNKITSEDILNNNEIKDPNDDETPLDSFVNDDEDLMDFVTSTTTSSTTISPRFRHKSVERKNKLKEKLFPSTTTTTTTTTTTDALITAESPDDNDHPDETFSKPQQSSMLFPGKPTSKKNLIKIGRWKYIDLRTKTIRYWYEQESGQMGTGWIFDGFLFQAYNKSEPDTEPVYAFHSEIRGVWTNTVQMDPKSPIIGNDQWIPDGVSFYAYRTSFNSTERQPVLRYWNELKTGATDATETRITYLTAKPVDDNSDEELGWTFDNVLFYVLPIQD